MTDDAAPGRPDLATAFALLRLINRDDAEAAYQLAAQCDPDELVVALVEAHLGSLRVAASRDLGAPVFSQAVTKRVDGHLDEALRVSHIARERAHRPDQV